MNVGYVSKMFFILFVIIVSIIFELLCIYFGIVLFWFVYLFNFDFFISCCFKDFVVEIKFCVFYYVFIVGFIFE